MLLTEEHRWCVFGCEFSNGSKDVNVAGKKIVTLFFVLGPGFSLGSFVVLNLTVFPAFEDYENELIEATLLRVKQALEADLSALNVINLEYSQWNHTYTFAQGENPKYIDEHMNSAQWPGIGVQMMAIFDAESKNDCQETTSERSAFDRPKEFDSVIDEATLDRLSLLQQPGAPNILRRLLGLYLQSSSITKERLGKAIDSSNAALIRESAHALKSSSQNVGAVELANLCKRLESMGRDDNISDGPTLRKLLESEYSRVVDALQFEMQGRGA